MKDKYTIWSGVSVGISQWMKKEKNTSSLTMEVSGS